MEATPPFPVPIYYLPRELEPLVDESEEVELWGRWWRAPRLSPELVGRVADGLTASAARAEPALSTARLVKGLGAVADAWLDPRDSHRLAAERLLPLITGYAPGMVAEALDRLFTSLRADALDELLRDEVGHLHSPPPRLLVQITAGTVFPPAIVGATCALLLRSPVVVKPSTSEPLLPVLWARSVAERDPTLGRLIAVLPWQRRRDDLTGAILNAADAIVAHGDDETIAALRAAAPSTARFIAHGHRVSGAILGARALTADARGLAGSLAKEVALYDQYGCLSPHTIFVEDGGAVRARAFAELLANALAELERRWPRAPLSAGEASALRQFLATRELASTQAGSKLLGGFDAGWSVIIDPEPGFEFSPLGRTVILKPVNRVETAIAALKQVRDSLHAVGLAIPPPVRLPLARGLGLYDEVETNLDWAPRIRLCAVGSMQSPPLTWAADGHRPLGSLCPRLPGRSE
jgi:hypothetical protein